MNFVENNLYTFNWLNMYKENVKRANLKNDINSIKSLSWEAASQFEDDSVDFVFIDADHSYESVIKDINAWLPKVKTYDSCWYVDL